MSSRPVIKLTDEEMLKLIDALSTTADNSVTFKSSGKPITLIITEVIAGGDDE